MADNRDNDPQSEKLPLSKSALYILEESRMVLPGIQALFGFQLIAVFNDGFDKKLGPGDQKWHLLAIALVVLSAGLIMTPAAYHRQTSPREVTEAFIRIATRFLLCGMLPLAMGVSIDFYLIAKIILHDAFSLPLALALFAILTALWFALPRLWPPQRLRAVGEGGRRPAAP
ncbi:MAG: hypothetical protein JWM16_6132 [Verrucomicrobiales bacterium]|nr:hypothetical protein [Verrucomicrobiales bacterium]